MGTPESIDWDSLTDEIQEIAHDFEVDLNIVVRTNHKFTMDAIDSDEEKELAEIEKGLPLESQEVAYSVIGPIQNFYDDLRRAERLLALVGLVTRFQHWIFRFAERRKNASGSKVKRSKARGKSRKSRLMQDLETLNRDLGTGPVAVLFFEEIETLRDSVIHGDSQMQWGQRKVADKYRGSMGADLTEEQLQESIQKAIQQVKWYDEKMQA